MNEEYKLFKELKSYILKNGERYNKKHGNWIKLQYTNNLFFQLDTWNSSIKLKEGNGEYEYWTGFNGKNHVSLGSDFGGFICRVEKELLNFYLMAVKIQMAKKQGDFIDQIIKSVDA